MTEQEEFEFRARMEAEQAAQAPAKQSIKPLSELPTLGQRVRQNIGNVAAGAVRGAGSIGSTLLYPIDKATDMIMGDRGPNVRGLISGQQPESRNDERRRKMDEALAGMGAETDSWGYKGGKIGAEIAGTLGVGGTVANGARFAAPALANTATGAKLLNAVASGGFKTGAPAATTLAGKAADLGVRSVGGAVNGGLSAGLVNPKDAGLGAAIGGALPGAAKVVGTGARYVGGKVASAVRGGQVSPEVTQLANRAAELGIDVPADRIARSRPLNALAASLNYLPGSGRAATEAKMQSQLNQALSKTFGENSDNVTSALRQARSRLGGEFDQVLQNNSVQVDQQFTDALTEASRRASSELGSEGQLIIQRQIDDILNHAGDTGVINGQAAYNVKRTLDRIGKRNSPEAFYANELKGDLMEALNRSLTPDASQAFATTRKQYGSMLTLDKMAQNGVDGDVSIARLANTKNIKNKELQELADISAQFLKAREGQHGAMQRIYLGSAGAALGGLPALAAGAVAGRGANMALNSRALKNLITGQSSVNPNGVLDFLENPALRQAGYRTTPLLGGD